MIFFSKKRIYADWAATTPLHPEVIKAMNIVRKMSGGYANPSAIYKEGVGAKVVMDGARTKCARLIGVKIEEVYFTSGGTEANTTIIQGVIRRYLEKGIKPEDVHIVSTSIEHSSILQTLELFKKQGVRVTYVNPNSQGLVDAHDILSAITPQTVLVTCMYVNNEIGTIQPVSKIGAGIRKIRAEKMANFPIFHTDASQAPLWLSCDIEGLRVDAMTLDAHKIQGPKGIGALVVRRHVTFEPLMVGGGQEMGHRPTTESIELISGFAKALEIAQAERNKKTDNARAIQKYFLDCVALELPGAIINGSTEKRLPNNINISLPNISDPEFAVLFLDKEGIACSTKSSCLKGEENSYVVKTLGGQAWRARNTLRFSLAPYASRPHVDFIVEVLKRLPK